MSRDAPRALLGVFPFIQHLEGRHWSVLSRVVTCSDFLAKRIPLAALPGSACAGHRTVWQPEAGPWGGALVVILGRDDWGRLRV